MKQCNLHPIRRSAHILLFLAGFVLILHNLTPHAHASEERDEMPASLGDWLAFAFQIDPGVGHLECFSQSEPIDLADVAVALCMCVAPDSELPASLSEFTPIPDNMTLAPGDPPGIRSRSQRAPPAFV